MCKNVLTFLYLPFSHRQSLVSQMLSTSQSTAYLAINELSLSTLNTLITIHNSFTCSLREKSTEHNAVWQLLLLSHIILLHTAVSLKSHIKAGIISLTWSPEQRGCEITASEKLNTCQSDPQWQATLLLPTLITQINIKLNTRACSVNFYVVKNDWLFASLHQRDHGTLEGYQSVSLAIETLLGSFYPPCMYNCECSLCTLPATSVDISHTILCDMHLSALAWGCSGTLGLCMQNLLKLVLGVDLL